MTGLAAAQRRMYEALVAPAADPAPAQALFAGGGRLGAAAGLAVYRRGYFLRLAACMREQFPALCHALGRGLFDDFVAEYIRDCPPMRHTLYDLGRRFADWIAANRPGDDPHEPWADFMVDLARFEYAVFALFDAPGNEGGRFATWDTPDARLRLQPAFALGSYDFPVADYYHAVRRNEDPSFPLPARCHIALVRTDYVTRLIPVSGLQHAFLVELHAGSRVDAALARVSTRFGLDAADVRRSWREAGGIRARWIESGFFVAADAAGGAASLSSSRS